MKMVDIQLLARMMEYPKETLCQALADICGGSHDLISVLLLATEYARLRRLLEEEVKRYALLPAASVTPRRSLYHRRRLSELTQRITEVDNKINEWAKDTKGEAG